MITLNPRTELRPLRRWARNRLANNPVSEIARLDASTIEQMAAVIGVPLARLVRQLEMFTPPASVRIDQTAHLPAADV